jgi:hypothetical protein
MLNLVARRTVSLVLALAVRQRCFATATCLRPG